MVFPAASSLYAETSEISQTQQNNGMDTEAVVQLFVKRFGEGFVGGLESLRVLPPTMTPEDIATAVMEASTGRISSDKNKNLTELGRFFPAASLGTLQGIGDLVDTLAIPGQSGDEVVIPLQKAQEFLGGQEEEGERVESNNDVAKEYREAATMFGQQLVDQPENKEEVLLGPPQEEEQTPPVDELIEEIDKKRKEDDPIEDEKSCVSPPCD